MEWASSERTLRRFNTHDLVFVVFAFLVVIPSGARNLLSAGAAAALFQRHNFTLRFLGNTNQERETAGSSLRSE
jgi:hypothetical protein